MIILGIHDGHNATAALLKDGEIIAAISEERLSRIKNDAGYPKQAIEKVLELSKTTPKDIDYIALATRFLHPKEFYSSWDWYKKSYEEQISDEKDKQQLNQYLDKRLRERKRIITNHLNVSEDKIKVVEHHLAHASVAYFGSDLKEPLVLTLDGSGDGVCSTVNLTTNSSLQRIAQTLNGASIGKIYSRITYLLGMKPWEHEFKLTGLAPYANDIDIAKSYEVIKKLICVDNLVFKNNGLSTNFCYKYLHKYLENHRFDWIAGAVQKLTEELVTKWLKNTITYTNKKDIACGGGVFMNVKVNMLLNDITDNLFVFPSCGDESLAIGAAYHIYSITEYKRPKPFDNIYLGLEYTNKEIANFCDKLKNYDVVKRANINKAIAHLLDQGEIIARFAGRMEWGARTLGNRSILANPSDASIMRELNIAIKKRDFWMPFSPTILHERQEDYIINAKNTKSPYMMIAFKTTSEGQTDLIAAAHPYDFTVRPQILEKKQNPSYYNLIKEFESLTGIGAVLNTSFNLHGEPIVCSLNDAINTFSHSGLKYLAIGNYIIEKRE